MSCGVGHRCGLDLVWLWLWHRPATTALLPSPAWEAPDVVGAALKKKKKKKKKKEKDYIHTLSKLQLQIRLSNFFLKLCAYHDIWPMDHLLSCCQSKNPG